MACPVVAAIVGGVLSCSVPAAAGDQSRATGAPPAERDLMVSVGAGSTVHYLFEYPDGSFTWTAGLRAAPDPAPRRRGRDGPVVVP